MIRLAALRPVDYDRVRKEEARRLGVRASTLDAEVEKHGPPAPAARPRPRARARRSAFSIRSLGPSRSTAPS